MCPTVLLWAGPLLLCAVSFKSLQSYLALCDPVDSGLPGVLVKGILQARILQRIVMPSFRGSSQPRDWWDDVLTMSLKSPALAGEFFTTSTTWEAHCSFTKLLLLWCIPQIHLWVTWSLACASLSKGRVSTHGQGSGVIPLCSPRARQHPNTSQALLDKAPPEGQWPRITEPLAGVATQIF